MDLSDEGSPFATSVPAADVAGVFPGSRSAADLAAHFVRAGWSSRSSSWEGYEVETSWARLEIDALDDGVLVHGGTHLDPDRFDALVAVLSARRLPFSVEFYGEDGGLLRETAGGRRPSGSPHGSGRRHGPGLRRPSGTRRGPAASGPSSAPHRSVHP